MRGLTPVAGKVPAQNFADGGVVSRIKGLFGVGDKEKPKPQAQPQSQQQASQPAPEPKQEEPKHAISQYAGGSALKRRMAEIDGYANGGMVRGKGTGTSDEVPDEVPEGTYIMPADSTQAIGPENLAKIGKVPVNLSNGEYKLPPEQVHAVGVQTLDAMKNATHTPVATRGLPGIKPHNEGEPRHFFADGGVVDKEAKRKPISPANSFPQGHPSAGADIYGGAIQAVKNRIGSSGTFVKVPDSIGQHARTPAPAPAVAAAPQPAAPQRTDAERQALVNQIPTDDGFTAPKKPAPAAPLQVDLRPTPRPMPDLSGAGGALADAASATGNAIGNTLKQAFPGTAAALQGAGDDIVGAYKQSGVGGAIGQGARGLLAPVIGFGDDVMRSAAAVLDPAAQALKTFVTGDATPINAAQPTPPSTGLMKAANAAVPPSTPSADAPVTPTPHDQLAKQLGGLDREFAAQQQLAKPAVDPTATSATASAADVAQPVEVMPGVYRQGNSYSDTAQGATSGAQTRGLPSAQNMAAADALANRQQLESMGRILASQQAAQPRPAPVVQRSTSVDPERARERQQLIKALTTVIPGARGLTAAQRNGLSQLMDQEARIAQAQENNDVSLMQTGMQTDAQREISAMREAGDTGRTLIREGGENSRASARNALDKSRIDSENAVRGLTVRAGQRQEKLYERYAAAKDDAERSAIAQQIRDLSGKTDSPWRVQVTPSIRNADGSTTEGSIIRINDQTGQVERVDLGARGLPPIKDNKELQAIVNDTSLPIEQRKAAYAKRAAELGYGDVTK